MMANNASGASRPAGGGDDLFAPQSAAEMARRLGSVPDPNDPDAASSLDAALEAELQGMLTRAMNLDTLDVEAAKAGDLGELSMGGRGAMLAELSMDLDEYEAVDQDIAKIDAALNQIDAQSNELKNMLQGLLISQEMTRVQQDDGAASASSGISVDGAIEAQQSSADSSDIDLDPSLQPL